MVLVGLGAEGSAGKASAALLAFLLFSATDDDARDGMGETLGAAVDELAQGVCPGLAPARTALTISLAFCPTWMGSSRRWSKYCSAFVDHIPCLDFPSRLFSIFLGLTAFWSAPSFFLSVGMLTGERGRAR